MDGLAWNVLAVKGSRIMVGISSWLSIPHLRNLFELPWVVEEDQEELPDGGKSCYRIFTWWCCGSCLEAKNLIYFYKVVRFLLRFAKQDKFH